MKSNGKIIQLSNDPKRMNKFQVSNIVDVTRYIAVNKNLNINSMILNSFYWFLDSFLSYFLNKNRQMFYLS